MNKIPVKFNNAKVGEVISYEPHTGKIIIKIDDENSELFRSLLAGELLDFSANYVPCIPAQKEKTK